MTIDYAHTGTAHRMRHAKARTLARWCYGRGIGPAILQVSPALRRRAARLAGVTPPHEPSATAGDTWLLVAELLVQRAAWDRAHQVVPPSSARCVACVVLSAPCKADQVQVSCSVCDQPLHPGLAGAGDTTHPSCDLPALRPASGQPPVLENIASPATSHVDRPDPTLY